MYTEVATDEYPKKKKKAERKGEQKEQETINTKNSFKRFSKRMVGKQVEQERQACLRRGRVRDTGMLACLTPGG